MRYSLLIAILAASCFAQELKRPSADGLGGNNLSYGCLGAYVNFPQAMPRAYDAAGLSTNSTTIAQGTATSTAFVSRVFTTWQPTTTVYTGLTLNVNWQATEVTTGPVGNACVAYSVNNGVTYTNLACSGGGNFSRITSSVALAPTQNLALIKVAACAQGARGDPDDKGSVDQIAVWDIWTLGTTGNTPTPGSGSSAGQANRDTVIVN